MNGLSNDSSFSGVFVSCVDGKANLLIGLGLRGVSCVEIGFILT